jgi:ABC-2 type transport system ATP-binding protein
VKGPAIAVEQLGKTYPAKPAPVVALADATFEVQPGEVIGLLGPNGAGKTTTIKCLCTLVRPSHGRALVGGFDVVEQPRQAVAQVAAVFEANRNLRLDLTARQNLQLYASLQGSSWQHAGRLADRLLDRLSLTSKRDTEAGKLSRGMQQKLAMAAALVRETPILVLDEPTLGLDVDSAHEVRACIRQIVQEGRTTLISSHDMRIVQELCDRVIIIAHGRVVAVDTIDNLLGLFRSIAYRIRITGTLQASSLQHLERVCVAFEPTPEGRSTVVDAQLHDATSIFEVMSILHASGVEVERVDSLEPDLEQVYLRVVAGAAPS